MNHCDFVQLLADHPDSIVQFALPRSNAVPAHFHVTEVGRVRKDFIDCGGTVRSEAACVMQIWVAGDVDHRLSAAKLGQIFGIAAPLLGQDDLPVEVEYETETISRYSVDRVDVSPSILTVLLAAKHTGCLAPDRCGLNVLPAAACGPTGCC